MTTSSLPSTVQDPASAGAGALFSNTDKSLDRDAFLQLLVTQLSNQDPLNPQEGHDFVAQLAQFSSVEQLTTIGSTLESHSAFLNDLAAGLDAQAGAQAELAQALGERGDLAAAAGLVGQTVEAEGAYAVWDGSASPKIGLALGAPAADVRVVVRDAGGKAVRTLELGHLGAGRHTPTWDGLGDDGQPAAPGTYAFTVEAASASGAAVEATPFTTGRVSRVTIEAEGVRFWIGPHAVPMGDLISLVS